MRYIRITEEPRRSAKVFIDRQRRYAAAKENHRIWWQEVNSGTIYDYRCALPPNTLAYADFSERVSAVGDGVAALVSIDDEENHTNSKSGMLAAAEFFRLRSNLREAFPYPLGYRGPVFRSNEGKLEVHRLRCPDCGGAGVSYVTYIGLPNFFNHVKCFTCDGFGSLLMEGRSDGRKAK